MTKTPATPDMHLAVCRTCPEFLGPVADASRLNVHCRRLGVESCCNKVSLLADKCPEGKWTTARARQRETQPGLFVHVGYLDKQYDDFARRMATSLGMEYQAVGVNVTMFETANWLKRASMVLVWNGKQGSAAGALRFCRNRNIPCWVYEWGLLEQDQTFLLDPVGTCGDSVLCGNLDWVSIHDFLKLQHLRRQLQQQYPIKPYEKQLLLLGQIENDTQMMYHSRYNSMGQVVRDVEQMYPDHDIIYRPHPRSKARPKCRRCVVNPEGTLLEMAAKSLLVVAVNSTGLYEAGILGVPVVALGDCPLKSHADDTERVLAGALALRLDRATGDGGQIVRRWARSKEVQSAAS